MRTRKGPIVASSLGLTVLIALVALAAASADPPPPASRPVLPATTRPVDQEKLDPSLRAMQRLAEIRALPPSRAYRELELLMCEPMPEPFRRKSVERLLEVLPKAIPLINPAEREQLDALRRENPAGREVLVSRYFLALCTPEFAERARANKLLTYLDVAYALYRDLFAVDPVQRAGHRFLIFPQQGKPGGHTTNHDTLKIMIGEADWDNADGFERFFHEVAHPFVNLNPGAHHLRAGGFAEGWPEFCQAFVPQRLAFLGPPFEGRWDSYVREFADCGRYEYFDTRLPIEDIVAYGPSSSFLMALALTTCRADGDVDWTPFKRLFRDAADAPQPMLPYAHWRAQLANDALKYFDPALTERILRLYRFPPPTLRDATHRLVERGPLPPLDCAQRRKTWADAGETVITDWRVLGPFPDPQRRKLGFDPIDEWNFQFRDKIDYGGRTYEWRRDVKTDACGTVHLGDLPGGRESCVFYLYTRLKNADGKPVTFLLSSDDDVSCWLDGRRIHTAWLERGVDVDMIDEACATPAKDGGHLLVKVANHGGPAGLHLRTRPGGPFPAAFDREELQAREPARRAAAIDYLASRRLPAEFVVPSLIEALRDRDPEVRQAAARGLGGRRNQADAVSALIEAWSKERDGATESAMRGAVSELLMRSFAAPAAAGGWWAASREVFGQWHFVECESVYGLDPVVGGWYGNQAAAYGRQCIARGWGNSADDLFEVPLRATQAGKRTLRLRYARGRDDPGVVHVRVRRGEQILQEKRDIKVARTRDWQSFKWLSVPLDSLEAGWYRVEVRTGGTNIDCDVIGWR